MEIFLYIFFTKLSLILSFIPIPKENGILNSPYSHRTNDNLYFIFEHFRHGARSPCNGKFVNNKDELGGTWKNYGFLSKVGIKQHFLLGLKNRKKYDNFISNEYNPKELKIFCSFYDRTMMSAQAQLLGFYNNKMNFNDIKQNDDIIGEEKTLNKMNLSSIIPPINIIGQFQFENNDELEMVFSEKFKCPLHSKMIKKNLKELHTIKSFNKINNIQKQFNEKYSSILSKEFKVKNYTEDYFGMIKFCDIFITYYFDDGNNNLILKNLEKKYNFFKSNEVLNICYDFFSEKFFKVEGTAYAEESTILLMSKSMKNIVNYMEKRINKKNQKYIGYDAPKFIMLSGHDDTLTQMQLFFHKFFSVNTEWVPFASTQVLELRKYGNSFYVELYYNDKLKMNITFKQFSQRVKNVIMTEKEINERCYGFTNSEYYLIIILLCLLLIIVFISCMSTKIYFYYFHQKNE